MHRIKKVIWLSILFCFVCSTLCSCTFSLKETQFFSTDELESYEAPVMFFESSDGKYFIALDAPNERYSLDYKKIWDSNSTDKTFLFCMETEGKEGIYEYDFNKKKYRCFLKEEQVCNFLKLSENATFASVYYCIDKSRISFLYGNMFCIYDYDREEVVYTSPFSLNYWEEIYGWRTSQTILMRTENMDEIYEVNVYTGEKIKLADDLGNHIILTDDRGMGCSIGDENWFGASFSPILIWDAKEYKVKRFREGIMYYGGRTQDSIYDILWW